jgi:hypothetical protein
LKVLSAQGDGPVYLAALSGAKKPCVIKTLPLQGKDSVDLGLLKAETKKLARIHSAHLAAVHASPEVESDGAFVMEYVRGKSLAAVCQRAEDYAVLLPPELGLVVAHDVFAATEAFRAFEGANRVHGNISPRTILVGYSGDVKVAGYRPGVHATAGVDVHVARDLKPVASMLCDLPFEMFPTELTKLVPRLLEDNVSPVEATAAVRAFLHDHVPSAHHRRRVAEWLKDIFLDRFDEEAQEEAQLLASAIPLLTVPGVRPVAKRVSAFGGTTALIALLVGGGALLMSHRRPTQAHSEAMHVATLPQLALEQALPLGNAPPASPTPTLVAPAQVAPRDPSTAAASTKAPSDTADNRPPKRESEEMPAERLLHAADAAFGAGKRIEAVTLALQAVNAGGGVRAHLALGEYYQSMHRYQDALNHYRAAAEIEPENKLALTGVRILEKKISPCQ